MFELRVVVEFDFEVEVLDIVLVLVEQLLFVVFVVIFPHNYRKTVHCLFVFPHSSDKT